MNVWLNDNVRLCYVAEYITHKWQQLRKLDVVTKQQMSVHHVQKAVNDTSGERILLNISLSNQLYLSSVIHPTAVSAGFVPVSFFLFLIISLGLTIMASNLLDFLRDSFTPSFTFEAFGRLSYPVTHNEHNSRITSRVRTRG